MQRRVLAMVSATFWVLVLAVIALFAFFVALGALEPGDVIGLTVAVALLAVLWLVHAALESRRAPRDVDAVRARERRGF